MKPAKYVTTNIRLPEDLWKELKMEAMHQGKRLSQVIRERLKNFSKALPLKKNKKDPLCGILKGIEIPDSLIEEAKRSVFKTDIEI